MTAEGFDDGHTERHRDDMRSTASSLSAQPTKCQLGSELPILHAVRLAGFADTEALADRTGLPDSVILETLRTCEEQHQIEQFTFADSGGWILTESGKKRDAQLLREELEATGVRGVVEATAVNFESVNPRLVQIVTEWQLQSSPYGTDRNIEVLRELTDIATTLSNLMTELVEWLPRFSRYPRQFSMACEKACAGDTQWIAGVGRLSCHIVWAELHEDLLSSLGRDRSSEADQAGM